MYSYIINKFTTSSKESSNPSISQWGCEKLPFCLTIWSKLIIFVTLKYEWLHNRIIRVAGKVSWDWDEKLVWIIKFDLQNFEFYRCNEYKFACHLATICTYSHMNLSKDHKVVIVKILNKLVRAHRVSYNIKCRNFKWWNINLLDV